MEPRHGTSPSSYDETEAPTTISPSDCADAGSGQRVTSTVATTQSTMNVTRANTARFARMMERMAVESPPGERARGATSGAAIELRGLRRDFGDRVALDGLDLRLDRGLSLAVLGPNGSGKTTLLRILAGLLRPSGGEVSVLGYALPKETYRLRGRVGYLGHRPLLYRDLTPRENLALAAALHGLDPAEAERRIEWLLEAVRMEARGDDRVAELSAGMQQRIDICRAVLHEPELLLLDEPDAHLDPEARRLVAPLIAAGEDRTRVVVSHDHGTASADADEVVELA
jgi:heme exporter protein A